MMQQHQEQHVEREDRRRSEINKKVAEEEHHPNTGGDDASYSSGISDLQHVTGEKQTNNRVLTIDRTVMEHQFSV